MRVTLLVIPLALAACSSGDRANKPDDQGPALNSLSPANTPDNEAAAAGQAPGELTNYSEEYTPDPDGNQYDRR